MILTYFSARLLVIPNIVGTGVRATGGVAGICPAANRTPPHARIAGTARLAQRAAETRAATYLTPRRQDRQVSQEQRIPGLLRSSQDTASRQDAKTAKIVKEWIPGLLRSLRRRPRPAPVSKLPGPSSADSALRALESFRTPGRESMRATRYTNRAKALESAGTPGRDQ